MSQIRLFPDEYPNSVPDNVLVSVALLTYNHAPYIRQAIDSVLMQETNFPFELCIGEDESTDGTREICIEYAKKHPDKIRLFLRHEKDKIYVAGRKTGKFNFMCTREACRGKYIALLEGDDFWIDNLKLQKQADYLEQNPECIFVVGRTLRLNMQTGESKMAPSLKKVGVMNFSHVLNGIVGHTSTICFRNGTMNHRDPTYTQAINGDWLTELILLENGGVFYVDKSVMSVYRITGTGIWTAIDLKKQIHSNFDTLLAYEPRVPAQWRKQFLQVKMEYEWLKIKQAGLLRNIPAIFSLFKRYPQFALAIPSRAVRSISSKLRRIFDISNNE